MNRLMRYLVSTVLLSLSLGSLVSSQEQGNQKPSDWATVTGRVVDASGSPLPGAKVPFFPMDTGVSGGMPRAPITDKEGRFRLELPAYPGRTRLCAVKEIEGYPNTQDLLFDSGNESMPIVYLKPGGHQEEVEIRLGAPDGTVQGSVTDAKTHAPVSSARITLHRSEPEAISSSSLPSDAHFFYALPPAPIEITVDAPGYQRWTYKDPVSGINALVLGASEHKALTVELSPN